MRGRKMSSANFVWPVHFARASTLRKGFPTTLSGLPLLPFCFINQNQPRKGTKWNSIGLDASDEAAGLVLNSLCFFVAALIHTHTNSRAVTPSRLHAHAPPL